MKISEMLGRLNDRKTDLHFIGVKSRDMSRLAYDLMANKNSLKCLQLTCCRFRNKDLEQMSLCFSQLNHLEELDFSSNKFRGIIDLREVSLPRSCRLLSVEGTPIGDEGMRIVCEQFPDLEALYARNCHLSDDSIQYVLRLKKLKRFFLIADNRFTERGINILAEGIHELPLETLHLSYLCETTRSPEITANLLDHLPTSIKELYISYNPVIGNNACCIDALVRLIERPSSLEYVKMEQLQIEDEDAARKIMSALMNRGVRADYRARNPAMARLYREQLGLVSRSMILEAENPVEDGLMRDGYVFEQR